MHVLRPYARRAYYQEHMRVDMGVEDLCPIQRLIYAAIFISFLRRFTNIKTKPLKNDE